MNQDPTLPLPPLEDLMERLDKADGHLNAADRRLSEDRERGLWSARQAVARIGEAWFRLKGAVLPPVEKYLLRDRLQQRLEEFQQAAIGTALATRLAHIADAEASLLAVPELAPPYKDRPALTAELDRQRHYLDAVRALKEAVEDAIAELYLPWRPGDWARLPTGHTGRMIDRRGLVGEFFIPAIAAKDPAQAFKGWRLSHPAVLPGLARIPVPADAPISSPAYYWLLAAHRHWQDVNLLAAADWATVFSLGTAFNALLDAAAKAWLSTQVRGASRQVNWSYISGQPHVRQMSETAPPALSDLLTEAEGRIKALSQRAFGNFSRLPPDWRHEVAEALRLVQQAMTGMEAAIQGEVQLAAGQWVRIAPYGDGQIAYRDGTRLVVSFSPNGVRVRDLFDDLIGIILPPEVPPAMMPEETRWLWFAGHPQACHGRGVCPCCGFPGLAEDGAHPAPCLICGWTHDGGDYTPTRPSLCCCGLNLAFGRRRFAALGYATLPPDIPPGHAAVWAHPLMLAQKLSLVAALDQLAADDDCTQLGLRATDLAWDAYQSALDRAQQEAGFT